MDCPEYELLRTQHDSSLKQAADFSIKLDVEGLNGLSKANHAIQQTKALTKVVQCRNRMDGHLKDCPICGRRPAFAF